MMSVRRHVDHNNNLCSVHSLSLATFDQVCNVCVGLPANILIVVKAGQLLYYLNAADIAWYAHVDQSIE